MCVCVCVSLERLMKEITLQHQVIFPALDCNQIFCTFGGPRLFMVTLLGVLTEKADPVHAGKLCVAVPKAHAWMSCFRAEIRSSF